MAHKELTMKCGRIGCNKERADKWFFNTNETTPIIEQSRMCEDHQVSWFKYADTWDEAHNLLVEQML